MDRVVIFDFDGVLINSIQVQKGALKESYNRIVNKEDPPYDEFFKRSGSSLEVIFSDLKLPMDMIPIYREYSKTHLDEIELFPCTREVLWQLHKMNIKIALFTGKDSDRTLQILKKFEIRGFFDSIVCSDKIEKPKPNPDGIWKIFRELNINRKNDAFLVGDAVNDIKCAHRAGIMSVAVTWGEGNRDDLLALRPNYIINNLPEIFTCLGESSP